MSYPQLAAGSPEVLEVGFRAAGWTCFAAIAISLVATIVWLRDIDSPADIEKVDTIALSNISKAVDEENGQDMTLSKGTSRNE